MTHLYLFKRPPRRLAHHLAKPLAGLALLLAPVGVAQAQTPASFAPLQTYASGGSITLRVVTGDLNGDGRVDAVTANITSNNVSVFLNNGNGTFRAAVLYNVAPAGVQVQGVTIGDVNADGRLDIVTANNGNSTIGVLLNQGSGIFGNVVTYTTGANGLDPRNVALGDVNGDGVLDAVTGNNSSATASVLLGLGGGTFGAPTTYATTGTSFDVALGDVTADGRLDIVTASYSTNSINVLPGQAGGTFGAYVNYSTGTGSQTVGVRLGDVNTDGRLDVVAANQNSTVSVLLGQAGGTLAAAANYSTGSIGSSYAVGIGDVNGDGRPDLVPGGLTNTTIGVLLGQASGFGPVTTYSGGNGSQGITLADVNADGKLDVLTANRNDNTLGVLLNTTNFVAPVLSSVNPTSGPVGTSVTLTGTNLTGATAVSFNGTAASGFTVVNATTITATVPTGATTGNVTVTTSGGTSNGVAFAVNPTVVISSSAGASGSTTTTTPLPFTITFSAAVTGFVAGDITVGNGTVTSGSFTGSGTTYSFTVTPTTAGSPTTVSVAADVAQAFAGTGNVASATYSLQYNAPITATTWTGAVSNDWFAVGNWTAGVPTASLDVTIPSGRPHNPVIGSGAAAAKNLLLNTNASLTQGGGTLTVSGAGFAIDGTFTATGGEVILNGTSEQRIGGTRTALYDLTVGAAGARLDGPLDIQRVLTLNGNLSTINLGFTLLSNSTGTAMVVNSGGVVSGQATVQRFINPSLNSGLGYRHFSSPVASTTVADLATGGFTPVVNPDYNTVGNTVTPFPTVYGYNEGRIAATSTTTQDFDYGYFSPGSLGETLTRGRGYTVNIGADQKVDLVGTLNTGTVAVGTLTRGSQASSGWQLLGNPYPSPLDWNKARPDLPAGVLDAVYVYKSNSQYGGTYQFYQNGVGTLPGGLIGSMQGFFVRVSQTVPAFSFLDTWRSTTVENPSFNRPTADPRPLVQLDLVSAQGVHEPAYVYFEAGATAGVDNHFDAEKLPNTTGLNLASVAAGTNLAINGLPLLGAATAVPLSVGVPTTGTYTLTAAALLNLGATDVYLHDALTGQQINLKQQPSYTFSASNAALITDRFTLNVGAQRPLAATSGLTTASVSVYPNPAHQSFVVAVPAVSGTTQVTLGLYNLLGQAVRTTTLGLPASGIQTSMDVQALPTGVYVLRVQAGSTTITKQVILK